MDNDANQNAITQAIMQAAHPVNKGGEADYFAPRRAGKYRIKDGIIEFLKPARDQSGRGKSSDDGDAGKIIEIPIALTDNFTALILEEVLLDDGENDSRLAYVIEGRDHRGRLLPPAKVLDDHFASMAWLGKNWGTRATLPAGATIKDNLRAAMYTLSRSAFGGDIPRKTIYKHTGWRQIGGVWLYLSGSGAIGESGQDTAVNVELESGHMRLYSLPAPHLRLHQMAGRLLELLHIAPENPAVGAVLLCAIARAPLGECQPVDFSLFLSGRSGSQKSECAALALACFGQFTARTLPANFTDTETDLELKAHQAKDAVFVVDDFAPSTNQIQANRLHAKAENLFRAVGNQAGKGRRNSDLTGRPAYHPRGLVIATGEDNPRGASLLGRLLVIEMKRGDVDLDTLSAFQHLARQKELSAVMAAYLQWLAPRMAELKMTFPPKIIEYRDAAIKAGFAASHPRAADIYASLYAGAEIFMTFIQELRVISEVEAAAVLDDIDMHLINAVKAQGDYQRHTDEVERFKELLRAGFASGEVHVTDHLNQGPPQILPHTWGWRRRADDEDLKPAGCGAEIGYINESQAELWLIPDSAYRAIQRFASQQNEPLLISQHTLWKRLQERGILLTSERDNRTGTVRPSVSKRIHGGNKRARVLVLSTRIITGNDEADE